MAERRGKRIVWMDWCKVLSMWIVIYCHLPQQYNIVTFYGHYFVLSTLFFMSGYLHHVQPDLRTALRKYWKTLIIPYLIMQVVFYPYWLAQQHYHFGLSLTDPWEAFFKPFLLSFVGVPLNGIMYYIVILLICKLLADVIMKSRYRLIISIVLSVVFIVAAYYVHYQQRVVLTYSIDHFFDNFQFFVWGFFAQQWGWLKQEDSKRWQYALWAVVLLAIGLLICHYEQHIFWQMRINYEIVSITGTLFMVNLCRLFTSVPSVIETLARGMIILFGCHWLFIGPLNLIVQHLSHSSVPTTYSIPVAWLIALAIMVACYFIIIFCNRHFPIIMGGRQAKNKS